MEDKQQNIPANATAQVPVSDDLETFRDHDPGTAELVEDMIAVLRQDMVPGHLQEKLFNSFNPAVKRSLIAQESGMDASVLNTFKSQLNLVDGVLRRTFNDDGSVVNSDTLAMSPKDVLNISLKVSQMMVKELPKVYNMDRIQRMEAAILKVIQKHLDRDQQDAFIAEFENLNDKLS